MNASSSALRLSTGLGLFGLALVLSLSLFVLVEAPQAQAAKVNLDGMRTTLTKDPGTTSALFGAGSSPCRWPPAPSLRQPTPRATRSP
jgi:hypothetical protein